MAGPGYLGYALQAGMKSFQTSFNMGMQINKLKWQKEQQKKIDDLNALMSDAWSSIGEEMITLTNDGYFSADDELKIQVLTIAAPYQIQVEMGKLRGSLSDYRKKDFDRQMAYMKTYIEYAQGLDPKDVDSAYKTLRDSATDPHVLALLEVADKKLKHDVGVAEEERALDITEKLPTEYKYPYLKKKGIVGEITPTPEAPKALSTKDNWAIENYKAGKINFNELQKYMGAYIAPEEMSTKEKEVELMKQYGATNEEIKNSLLGITVPKPETVTTLKNWETMFDITSEEGPRTEEEYNRVLELLAQSEDIYKPKYASWKEALIAEAKGIGKELEGITDRTDRKLLLDVYKRKLEEIKAKYPDVDLSQFPQPKELSGWEKFLEKVGF